MTDKESTLNAIREVGLLAVLRGPSEALTLKMVEALVKGGVTGIEITFTTPNALRVVSSLERSFGGDIVLGMGTLTRVEHAGQAAQAGASFLVSPHTEEKLASAMVATGLPTMMGALSPSEVMRAVSLKSDVVKIFPASLGGPAFMKALKGPFPDVPMMPTGGVSYDNLADWFQAGAFAVGAGSNLCPKPLVQEDNFAEITAIAKRYTEAVQIAKKGH